MRRAFAVVCLLFAITPKAFADLSIAAASDLRPALEQILQAWNASHPDSQASATYGSSGRFATQIRNGAPFDLYMSADITYPRALQEEGLTDGEPRTYALGRLVLWSRSPFPERINELANTEGRIAIARPEHAPYGARAREALVNLDIWNAVEPRLVYGESISHTAQMAQSGAAEFALLALSLVGAPNQQAPGHWQRIPVGLHSPLEQALVVTLHGAGKHQADQLADYLLGPEAAAVLVDFGFERPPVPGGIAGQR
ncbi:molybdate transport system substrate-binding protein [Halopseudomonas xinjiangensis]|uniref:Molybdate transport system substrate-binding protein n=1 Tax=Halopseudomonas xinjiangensis TaxID=487184 RepID=A0A1H1N6P4_9GAMM|nr:molybdate ABC transporter substrate-binding protein [Halopseudomonas xinjiangensis]SDR94682.1 molybdate transport system substrate-binding protein [Halopseudomonas xinjiangensis]